jgi:spore maturation protein CgeB
MSLSILYCGALDEGQTALMRLQALEATGATLKGINSQARPSTASRLLGRIARVAGLGPDLSGTNRALLEAASDKQYDVLWIDKGVTIREKTLQLIKAAHPKMVIVGYSPDDMLNPSCTSRSLRAAYPLYDIYFTTKTFNVPELLSEGCRRVEFVGNAYCSAIHRPWELTHEEWERYRCDVGFIGAFEQDRALVMQGLCDRGVPVRTIGIGWNRPARRLRGAPPPRNAIWGAEYSKAVCATKINLGFLRKINRDQQTTRSIEIPACGAFMLAERTAEHLELFDEGKEAEFFSSDDELYSKCQFYLANDAARMRIARAGRERCIRSGYSYESRLASCMQHVQRLCATRLGQVT